MQMLDVIHLQEEGAEVLSNGLKAVTLESLILLHAEELEEEEGLLKSVGMVMGVQQILHLLGIRHGHLLHILIQIIDALLKDIGMLLKDTLHPATQEFHEDDTLRHLRGVTEGVDVL